MNDIVPLQIEIQFNDARTIEAIEQMHLEERTRVHETHGRLSGQRLTLEQFVKDLICEAVDRFEAQQKAADFDDDEVIGLAPAFDREPCIVV